MPKRVALYLRASKPKGPPVEIQRRDLRQATGRPGWEVVAEFVDSGLNGIKNREKRPGFGKLCEGIGHRDFDMVAAWSVERLSSSLQHLVGFLEELKARGVGILLLKQGIDSTTPAGKALLQMSGVFAECEHTMIVERVKAGLARAKAEGKRLGRPTVPAAKEAAVRASLKSGNGFLKTARKLGVGSSTVQRIRAGLTVG
jgi:DNA invertase Pin-like site-specific DNA recombinase